MAPEPGDPLSLRYSPSAHQVTLTGGRGDECCASIALSPRPTSARRAIIHTVTSSWDPPLPDPALWRPKRSPEALKASFRNRCLGAERLIKLRAELERGMNINNFDSGPGVED